MLDLNPEQCYLLTGFRDDRVFKCFGRLALNLSKPYYLNMWYDVIIFIHTLYIKFQSEVCAISLLN